MEQNLLCLIKLNHYNHGGYCPTLKCVQCFAIKVSTHTTCFKTAVSYQIAHVIPVFGNKDSCHGWWDTFNNKGLCLVDHIWKSLGKRNCSYLKWNSGVIILSELTLSNTLPNWLQHIDAQFSSIIYIYK